VKNIMVNAISNANDASAECNKELCSIMADKVALGEFAMKRMLKKNNSDYYYKKYFTSFKRFENILINIKDFTNKASKLEGYRKFLGTIEVKKEYEKLIKDFDTSMNDLQFNMVITNEGVDESLKAVEE
ncbi:2413_t:CDS:2, partial [Dentiscutata heterogama]